MAGATLAGKTGTAEIDVEASLNQPWFIGFSPADDPQIAVAATIERCTGCFGGDTAGPIATDVMESSSPSERPVLVAENTVVDGRYRILNRLGSGGWRRCGARRTLSSAARSR